MMDWQGLTTDCLDFARRLIRLPSLTYQEAALAEAVAVEMRALAFDEVWLDAKGNVYGRLHGRDRNLPALVLNSHTDHVDPGDPALWSVPPYEAVVKKGRLIGRGACDIKGPLAVQIYAMAALIRQGIRPARDVVFCGVVEEELGGGGAQFWVENLDYPVDMVVLGEPSSNRVSLGHRGILQLWITFHGQSVHACNPGRGINPNYALAAFLTRLERKAGALTAHPRLGPTTIAPTIITVDTTSPNVTPAWTRAVLDCRTATESASTLLAFLSDLAGDHPHTIGDVWAETPDMPPPADETPISGYDTDPENEVVRRAVDFISQGMGRRAELSSYQFATDGRLFVPYNLTIIGYGPGDESAAHTADESIAVAAMTESLKGYVELLRTY